jgi:hypothetical protein
MKSRILILAAMLFMLCSVISNAADLSVTPTMVRLAGLTIGGQSEKQMTPRSGARVAQCTPENVRCSGSGSRECCGVMFCDCPSGSACLCRYR